MHEWSQNSGDCYNFDFGITPAADSCVLDALNVRSIGECVNEFSSLSHEQGELAATYK